MQSQAPIEWGKKSLISTTQMLPAVPAAPLLPAIVTRASRLLIAVHSELGQVESRSRDALAPFLCKADGSWPFVQLKALTPVVIHLPSGLNYVAAILTPV